VYKDTKMSRIFKYLRPFCSGMQHERQKQHFSKRNQRSSFRCNAIVNRSL